MESYRAIWNNFFNYLKEHWHLKDCEKIEAFHVAAYMDYKIEYYPSKQYLEKISAALGKLELALKHFAKNIHGEFKEYDFSIRQTLLDEARDLNYVVNNYHNRAYINPEALISNLINPLYRLAATIQYEGGKEGKVLVSLDTYSQLQTYLSQNITFKINRQAYYDDIKQAALLCKESPEASHGLRWNFAKRRMFEYARAGYNYEQSLQQVSYEMKHNRASITKHYLDT